VRDLRPKKSTRNVRDTADFGVKVLLSGRKRFFLHSQHDGQHIWKIIGDPADMTGAEADGRAWKGPTHARGSRDTGGRTETDFSLMPRSTAWVGR